MTQEEFVAFVKKECKYYGIKCSLRNTLFIKDGKTKMTGYFSSETRELACAMKSSVALDVLVHEYCHLKQWVEKADCWMIAVGMESYEAWARHLDGETVPNMSLHFGIMRDLELDNEKRSADLIRKFNLPIDLDLYIQKANASVHIYNWMIAGGDWTGGDEAPYNNPEILEVMPTKFSMNYLKLPPKYKKAMFRAGYKLKK